MIEKIFSLDFKFFTFNIHMIYRPERGKEFLNPDPRSSISKKLQPVTFNARILAHVRVLTCGDEICCFHSFKYFWTIKSA